MSSSSSSSSSFQGGGNDDDNAGGSGTAAAGTSTSTTRGTTGAGASSSRRQRGTYFQGPSSSRPRINEVWPEHFIEALAAHVAIEAAASVGRFAAAPALANVFQVCSTWRAVSNLDSLWHRITRRIWGRTHLRQATWREEYIFWHRRNANFRTGHRSYTVLQYDPSDGGPPNGLICLCLTLSDNHLACGFTDGSVRLFHLPTRRHVRTFSPHPGPMLGPFSRAVTGIVITNNHRLVFATLDGDIHVAIINGPPHPRRAHVGNVVENGVLVDFTGCGHWWVGLYAGVPGRAFHIWDGNTEQLSFVGGSLTDPESVTGWQMLIELNLVVGRVRVTSQETAVACTSSRTIVFDLRNQTQGVILGEEEHESGLMVRSLDVSNSSYIIVDNGGIARVRRAGTLEELRSFTVRRGAWQSGLIGCMNLWNALLCAGGVIRAWDIERGEFLYGLAEVGEVSAMVADERHVVACSNDATLHLWDFGAQ